MINHNNYSNLKLLAIIATSILEAKTDSQLGMPIAICKSCKCALYICARRAGPDGTLLCNACGIRWRKYKVECDLCGRVGNKTYNGGFYCAICTKLIDK